MGKNEKVYCVVGRSLTAWLIGKTEFTTLREATQYANAVAGRYPEDCGDWSVQVTLETRETMFELSPDRPRMDIAQVAGK